jgi:hypothetical protein
MTSDAQVRVPSRKRSGAPGAEPGVERRCRDRPSLVLRLGQDLELGQHLRGARLPARPRAARFAPAWPRSRPTDEHASREPRRRSEDFRGPWPSASRAGLASRSAPAQRPGMDRVTEPRANPTP